MSNQTSSQKNGVKIISKKIHFLQARVCFLSLTRSALRLVRFRGRFRLGKFMVRLLFGRNTVLLKNILGSEMEFDFSNDHEISMYYDLFAPELTAIITEALSDGDIFIDCGANTGYFTFMAASVVGPTGKVVSIDANPYCVNRLNRSQKMGKHKNVLVLPIAVGSEDGSIAFNLADDPMYSSLVDLNQTSFAKTKTTISVPMERMDKILSELNIEGTVKLLKLDVEGAELDVLYGGSISMRAENLEFLYLELHRKQMSIRGQDPEEVLGVLESRGFNLLKKYSDAVYLYGSR